MRGLFGAVSGVFEEVENLRGAKVTALPPDGTAVDATVHDRERAYYITDVKAKK